MRLVWWEVSVEPYKERSQRETGGLGQGKVSPVGLPSSHPPVATLPWGLPCEGGWRWR